MKEGTGRHQPPSPPGLRRVKERLAPQGWGGPAKAKQKSESRNPKEPDEGERSGSGHGVLANETPLCKQLGLWKAGGG